MELSLSAIETELTSALKSRDQIKADVLRALKTRVQNFKIEKQSDLSSEDIISLVKSEIKKRKDSIEMYSNAGRQDSADKEQQEVNVLQVFLPEQVDEETLSLAIDTFIADNNWTKSEFGPAMSKLKEHFGASADGAMIAKLLKAKLG